MDKIYFELLVCQLRSQEIIISGLVNLIQWNLDLTNLDITSNILCPGQSYSKMYGIEPQYNEFFDIRNIIQKPKRKIYLDLAN